jgi:hypothetical protein
MNSGLTVKRVATVAQRAAAGVLRGLTGLRLRGCGTVPSWLRHTGAIAAIVTS